MKIIFLLASICLAPIVRSQMPGPDRPFAPLDYVHPKRPYNYRPGPPAQAPAPPPPPAPYQNQYIPPAPPPPPAPYQNQYIPPAPPPPPAPYQNQYIPPAPPPPPAPYQNQYIPPAPAPQSQQSQYGRPAQQPGYNAMGQHATQKRQIALDEQMGYPEQEVMDGVEGIAEEIVEAVVNRIEADEAMAAEMEKQGVDPDAPWSFRNPDAPSSFRNPDAPSFKGPEEHSFNNPEAPHSSKDRIHIYTLKMYIISVVVVVFHGVLVQ